MKNRILIFSLAAALGVGGLFAVNVHAESRGSRRAPGARVQRAKEHLGITDDQAVMNPDRVPIS